MTASAPSPQAAKPGPSRRAIVGWTAGMFAALALAWFVGTVAVPAWRTAQVVSEQAALSSSGSVGTPDWPGAVETLGGPREAARRLRVYLSLPDAIAEDKGTAVDTLGSCGEAGLRVLLEFLAGDDAAVRAGAARTGVRGRKAPS